jgi:cobalt-precorrin 5A hydrolase
MDLAKTMIVAGIGCRKGVGISDVLAAIHAACVRHGIDLAQIEAIAVAEVKADEQAIHAAAHALNVTVLMIARSALEKADAGVLSNSALSIEVAGVASASEAAALAAIGPAARLLGPRIAVGPVTCALASDGVSV